MTSTKTVKTSEIKVGDIVRAYGMRVRIDEINEYEPYRAAPGEVAWSCPGTVLNLDEVRAAGVVPMGWLTTEKWIDGEGWTIDRRDHWTIQGNDLASWVVEVKPQPPRVGDRGYFQGFSAVVQDIDTDGPFPRALLRYAATTRSEWVAADAFVQA